MTPFLHEEFNKSISYGGTVLICASLGMGGGSLIGGVFLQRRTFNHYTLMAGGALAVMVGLLLAFPPEFITPLYNVAPYTAVVGTLLAGIGDPIITVSTLKGLYSLQVKPGPVTVPSPLFTNWIYRTYINPIH